VSELRRVAILAGRGLGTWPGLVMVLIAGLAMTALLLDDLAARVVAAVGLGVSTLLALALVGRRHRPSSPAGVEKARPTGAPVRDWSDERMVDRARTGLLTAADGLGLVAPPPLPADPAPDAFRPLVTVIVPVFNAERFVAAALESVRRQTYQSWECVMIDDGSTDGSLDVVQREVGSDDRFRLIRSESNLGPGAARNRGIAKANGRYLAFLDADDLLLGESLADRVTAIGRTAGDPFVVGSFCAVRFSPEDVALDDLPDRRHVTQPDFIDFVAANGECPFTMIAPLVSTELVRALGGLDVSMRTGGVDWDLWYRILRNGYVFVPTRTLGAVYRQRGGGITRGNPAAHTAAAAALIRAAYDTAAPGLLLKPSPYPLLEPLPAYQARVTIAERAIRFAAMALVDGDHEEMESTLAILEPGTWSLLERHLDLPALVARGAARTLGVRPRHMETLAPELAPFVAEVGEAVRAASK
jgi:teichuronic acid biosynthesis glycosyltransferase TuaG